MPTARYDGHTEWYESFSSGPMFTTVREAAVELVGNGPGRCLDLGCGTGLALPILEAAGWTVVAADASADQLAVARTRTEHVVQADAHDLPFANGEFDAVVSIFTHTDFDDVSTVFAEVNRVLRPGGVFAYAGVHPCFASPFVEHRDDGPWLVHPGYRRDVWNLVSRNPEQPGISSHVGFHHVPLTTLLNAVLASGLRLTRAVEPGDGDPPLTFGFRAEKR